MGRFKAYKKSDCIHAMDLFKNEIKEVCCNCEEYGYRNITHGECLGNCSYQKPMRRVNEFGVADRVSDKWLSWEIEHGGDPIWIKLCLLELQERREAEKHSTPKGKLERNIKRVFERDFNDLSIKQLGEIASIIMDCGECPIFDCVTSERCNVVFEDALRTERRGEGEKSE